MTEEVARQEPATTPGSPPSGQVAHRELPPGVPEPPPDDQNPAIIDAHRAFIITIASILLFAAFVVLFVL
jgi:hypothetical protein